jgi:putative N-acetylmannosamine-6-phosphate epimerase/predicted NBD/HSP70 family sugar kinase
MSVIGNLKGQLIVSCQAEEGFPLNTPQHLAALAQSAVMGGAGGIRASGPENINAIRQVVEVPIIGIYKVDYPDSDVRITPTFAEVGAIIKAGADIIAMDATHRPRPHRVQFDALFKQVKTQFDIPIMADISTFEEGINAARLGVDMIGTTLSGYTNYSRKQVGPDIQLVRELAEALDIPIIAEGRISSPEEAYLALNEGAYSVVVGSMITRPHLITERFITRMRQREAHISVIALDIGGTKIASGIVDPQGHLYHKEKIPTKSFEGGAAILEQVIGQIERLLEKHASVAPTAVGISTGGQVDRAGRLIGTTDMFPDWVGVPLKEAVTSRFGLPCAILNDGHAAALGEACFGAGRGQLSMLCIVIGTGLGGGLIIGGKIQQGHHGLAGSIGQLKVSPEPGLYVPLEAIVSGPGLVQAYNRKRSQAAPVSSGEQVTQRARQRDSLAGQAIQEIGEWLGFGLSHALHTYDAACVVIGGSVAQIGDLLFDSARRSLRQHGHTTVAETPILAALLGPEAGLIGAAIYAWDHLAQYGE